MFACSIAVKAIANLSLYLKHLCTCLITKVFYVNYSNKTYTWRQNTVKDESLAGL